MHGIVGYFRSISSRYPGWVFRVRLLYNSYCEPTLHSKRPEKQKGPRVAVACIIVHAPVAYTPTHVEQQPRRRGV
jgi:hypothetical protein